MSEDKKADVWMPIWIGSYLADTLELTTEQHGAYFLLLLAYWRKRGPLPDNDDSLRSITKLEKADWRRHRAVLAGFFRVADGVWWHKRVEAELAAANGKLTKAANGGSKRWDSDGDAEARGRDLRSKRLSEARQKGTHTPEEWSFMKAFHGCCVRCGAGGELVKDHILPIYQGGSDAIDNLQPLCRRCNASKGPEGIDHRKEGWRDAINEGIKRLRDAFPPPSPLPPPSEGIDPNGSRRQADDGLPACPHDEIIRQYHLKLPELPQVKLKTDGRQKAMRSFWRWVLTSKRSDGQPRASTADQALTWISSYFERAGTNDFLMGRAGGTRGHENWRCDLDFLLTERGRKHVIERTVEA